MNIDIKKASIEHIETIANFQVRMALETENLSLDRERVGVGVEKFFKEPARGFYLVAVAENKMVGCVLVQREWSDWRNRDVWWLHSVYVLPAFRKKGIFKRFFAHIERLATASGIAAVRLYVEKTNKTAQQVYKNLGMTNQHYELFEKMLI